MKRLSKYQKERLIKRFEKYPNQITDKERNQLEQATWEIRKGKNE